VHACNTWTAQNRRDCHYSSSLATLDELMIAGLVVSADGFSIRAPLFVVHRLCACYFLKHSLADMPEGCKDTFGVTTNSCGSMLSVSFDFGLSPENV